MGRDMKVIIKLEMLIQRSWLLHIGNRLKSLVNR